MEWISFIVEMATLAAIYAIMAVAFNVQYGYTRLLNFGIVAWFAVGAYTYTILTTHSPLPGDSYIYGFGFPIIIGMIGAGIIPSLLAFLVGIPTLKLTDHYFAIVTFAFSEIVRYVLINERSLTNGTVGFYNIRRPWVHLMSGSSYPYFLFFFVVAILLLTYFLINNLCNAPFGRVLKGIRDNETVCLSLGKKVSLFKMKALVVTSFFMGIAGSLYAMYMTLVTPSMFHSMITFLVLFGVVVGGKANNKGAITGMFLLIFFDQFTRFIEVPTSFATKMSSIRPMIYGLLLIVILRFLPKGIVKERKVLYDVNR